MAKPIEELEAVWLEQYAQMKAALSNLPTVDPEAKEYGNDLNLSDQDFTPSTGEDLWDFISNVSEDESDEANGIAVVPPSTIIPCTGSNVRFDRSWLENQCWALSRRSSGLDASALEVQILDALGSEISGKGCL